MLGCGVVSAGIPRIAAQQPFNAQPPPFHYTLFSQSFTGILGTCWGKSTCRRFKRANQVLIGIYQLDQNSAHLFSTRLKSAFKPSTCVAICASECLTITTISNMQNLTLCWRNVSLMILFTLFRSVAQARVFFPTIIPSLAFFLQFRSK